MNNQYPEILSFPYIRYYAFIILIFLSLYLFLDLYKRFKSDFVGMSSAKITYLLGISLTGLTIGLISGNSRNSFGETIIASLLLLITGFVVHVITSKINKPENPDETIEFNSKSIIYLTLISISLSLSSLYGINIGSKFRMINNHLDRELEFNEFKLKKDYEYNLSNESTRDTMFNSVKKPAENIKG